jgi:hypothetical protein
VSTVDFQRCCLLSVDPCGDEFCFSNVSVVYQRPLPMDQDGVSPRSTYGVPKDILSGFILAELSGYSSDSALQEETSEGVSK